MGSFLQDVRFGARILLRSPGVTTALIAALALGIGANSAMFSVVDALLLHPLHFEDLSALTVVWERNPQGSPEGASAADFLDWRAHATSFTELAGWGGSSTFVLQGANHSEQITGAAVTANFFHTLGIRPLLGRAFLPDEDGLVNPANASRVCVIGYELWQETFGGDPNILGRTISLNRTAYSVVGVMPLGFRFYANGHQVWLPSMLNRTNRDFHDILVIGRLKQPAAKASIEMSALARNLELSYPKTNTGWGAELQDLREVLLDRTFRTRLLLLSAALGLVLAIACANIASLLLARSTARTREIAVRISMGATRIRLVRQLLTESLLLALAGGTAGIALAYGLVRLGPSILPPNALPGSMSLELNMTVVWFTLAISLGAGVLFGLAPAITATRPDVQATLKDSGRSSTGGRQRQRFRQIMAGLEIAVAVMLLATAGVMVTTLRNMANIDLGFRAENVLAWSLYLPATTYDAARALDLHRRVLQRVASLPGVTAATMGSNLPLKDATMHTPFLVEGEGEQNQAPSAGYVSIDSGYLETLGIPLRRGRPFSKSDTAHAPAVAIVNEAFVNQYLAGRNPLGLHLDVNRPILGDAGFEPSTRMEIVGVVGNVKLSSVAAAATPLLYVPHEQNVWRRVSWFAIRTSTPPLRLAAAVRREMAQLEPDQPIGQMTTLQQSFETQFAEPRFQASLMGAFAAVALLLAVAGVYAINANAVAQRRHEIGLRMALGASPAHVLREVIGDGLKLAACGIAAGIAGALAIASLLKSVLVGVSGSDPLTLGAVSIFLAVVAAAACSVPALRAARTDPATALRQD
jgi:putative ABC transport system permease protein